MNILPAPRRLLSWLILIPLALLLLVMAIAGIAISTETGLNTLLGLVHRFAPGQLSYERISGRLAGPLHIERLRYEDGPLRMALASADFDWKPTDLFSGVLNIVSLRVEGLDLRLPPSQEEAPPPTEPFTLPDIELPLAITVADLQGRDIHIQPAGAEPIQIDTINLKAHTGEQGLAVETLEVNSPLGSARLNGHVNPIGNYPLHLQLAWQFHTPNHGTLTGEGQIQGELRDKLRLTHKLTGPATLNLDGEASQILDKPAWSVKARLNVADLKPFAPDLAGKPLAVQLDTQGTLEQFQGRGEINATLPELGPATARFTATGDQRAIKLDELRLSAADRPLALNAKGAAQLADLRFNIAGQWQSLVWPLTGPAQVESAKGEFAADGVPRDYRFQLTADLQGPAIPKGRWNLTGQGSDQAVRGIKLNGQTLEGSLQANADATWAPAISWRATLNGAGLNPGAHWKDVPGKLNFRLKSEGGLENSNLRANLLLEELAGTLTGQKITGNADVTVQNQKLTIKTLRLNADNARSPGRPLAFNANGDVQLADLRFKLSGQWQSLAWPLTAGPAQVESAKGEFAADGTPKDYRFQLSADLQGADIPKGRWNLTGQGSDQAVRDVKLSGQTLEGALQAAADATWAPTIGWRATLNGAGLNPGAHWKDVPGKLNFRLKSDGGLDKSNLRANLLLEELAGTLTGQQVGGSADITVQNQNLTIKALRLNAGNARLEANGALAERWDLRWKLDAPQLKSLVPALSGTVASTGNLSGSRDRPVVATQFMVRDLRQGDTQIKQLRGEANIDIGSASRSQVKVSGEGLRLGGQNWKTVQVDGSGTPATHDLKAELIGDPGSFLLALAGALQMPAMTWQGRITQLSAKGTAAGAWNLEKPASIRASAKEASLDLACLGSAPTRLCLQGQWKQSGDFNGRVQLSNLSPERFKAFLPQGTTLTTNINGDATASGKIGGALQGKLNVTIAPGNASMLSSGRPVRVNFNGGNLQLDANGQTANGQFRLDLAQIGQVQANARVQDPLGAARLNGKVNASITDLTLVSAFAPQLRDVSGQVRANVDVTGSASKPVLRGDIRLENAGLSVPDAGLKLQDIRFTAASTSQGLFQLSGSVRSDPGQMQLSGQLDPLKPQLNLNISGQNFQALKTTDVQVQISPDLKLDITSQQARIEGMVTIPRASISPGGAGRPGTIKASEDAVIVKDRDGKVPQTQAQGMKIFADVRVVLGQDVQLNTPVFKGKLQGDLRVVETPELAPRGSGNVAVVAGKYKIYGEEIDIQRGQLLFSNSPLDNPGLDLRVARQGRDAVSSDEITAGAQVRGTLKKPQLTLFSQPKMSDPDILAYLVLGRAPQSGGSTSETAMLFKAASALGSGGGGGVTKSLGDTFGLDSVELGGSGGDDTSLMLGKYLTPNLYVGYGVGLLDAINTFNVKYQLSKYVMFESASSSIGTGADVTYTIER